MNVIFITISYSKFEDSQNLECCIFAMDPDVHQREARYCFLPNYLIYLKTHIIWLYFGIKI